MPEVKKALRRALARREPSSLAVQGTDSAADRRRGRSAHDSEQE